MRRCPHARDRGGFAAGNVALALAVLALAAALSAPLARQRAFEARLELAISDVEELRARARIHREEHGSWPAAAELAPGPGAGATPQEVGSADGGAAAAAEPAGSDRGYRLEWTLWQGVRPSAPPRAPGAPSPDAPAPAGLAAAPPPPEVHHFGSITLRTHDERLLAGLLRRFGDGVSFVRDSSWTLLLAPSPGPTAAASP